MSKHCYYYLLLAIAPISAYGDSISIGLSSNYTSTQFEVSKERQSYYIVLPDNIIIERPSEINNFKNIETDLLTSLNLGANIESGNSSFGLTVDVQHKNSKVLSSNKGENEKTSGYYRTLGGVDYSLQISKPITVGFSAFYPIENNDQLFREINFVTYGGYITLRDAENMALSISVFNTKTDDLVVDQNRTIKNGDTINAMFEVLFAFNRRGYFFLGAEHYQKRNDIEFFRGAKREEFGASNGTGARFGVNYSLGTYADGKHSANFLVRQSIDDVKGSVTLGYKYAFR